MGSKYTDLLIANVTARNDATPIVRAGTIMRDEDARKTYRYVQFDNGSGNVAAIVGGLAYWLTYPTVVTMDVSDSDRNLVCGVFPNIPTDLNYFAMQTGGEFTTVTTNGDDDIAKADAIIGSAAGDGTCDSTAQDTAPTNRVVGWALAADVDANNTVSVFLLLDD